MAGTGGVLQIDLEEEGLFKKVERGIASGGEDGIIARETYGRRGIQACVIIVSGLFTMYLQLGLNCLRYSENSRAVTMRDRSCQELSAF